MAEDINSIDASIKTLDDYVKENQKSSRRLFSYLLQFSLITICGVVTLYFLPYLSLLLSKFSNALHTDSKLLGSFSSERIYSPPEFVLYGLLAIFVVVFGVLMTVYRFHLNEIARAEHYKIGFMRIRVAANNHDNEGFNSEVRTSLTNEAFTYNPSSVFASKDKKVKSPLPGHPTSDLSAIILNKLLDGLEVKKK